MLTACSYFWVMGSWSFVFIISSLLPEFSTMNMASFYKNCSFLKSGEKLQALEKREKSLKMNVDTEVPSFL